MYQPYHFPRPKTRVRGESHGSAKLTTEKVIEIRRRYGEGESAGVLAVEFNVSASTICNIAARRIWKHI